MWYKAPKHNLYTMYESYIITNKTDIQIFPLRLHTKL